jgi:mannobiose 2-epimerase
MHLANEIEKLVTVDGAMFLELNSILDYWSKNTVDEKYGGFYAQINNLNEVNELAPKGVVLNTRILWTFSAAFRRFGRQEHELIAKRAFEYIQQHFVDEINGGLYWSVDYAGNGLDTKKQVYAQAFAIYAYAEYYLATGAEGAKVAAVGLFNLLEKYAHDDEYGGYTEAFAANWLSIQDLRLSEKDANEPKSMNTHLHVLEAYTNLYRVLPNENLYKKIETLLAIFRDHIIDGKTGHLHLFFSMNWQVQSSIVSYGHDIEASWLLQEAAEVIKSAHWISATKILAIQMAQAAARGLDSDGGIWYENDVVSGHFIYEKHWWPQAEALVGFYNAWQISGNEHWLQKTLAVWQFIYSHIIDHTNGEWFWGVKKDYTIMPNEDKAGFWKCPYHNSRALLEMISRSGKYTAR